MKTFTKLRKLIWIDLSDNRIGSINLNIFPRSLVTIDLSRNIIGNLPVPIFEHLHDLKILSLKDNLIKNLDGIEFLYRLHMEKLDLSVNDISKIPMNLFNSSVRVKALNFDKNFIQFIPFEAFKNIGIIHLVLAFNFIEKIHEFGFVGLENTLEYLDLERNRLQTVPDAINILKKLRYLYLTSNQINNLTQILSSTLRVLSLSGNNFNAIPTFGLLNCTELSYLNMGYNKISEIRESEFIGWGSQLQTLLLRNNKITSLNYGIFNGLDSIKEISLSFNDIHYVHPNVFENISKTLKILELSFGIYRDDFPLEALSYLTELMWLGLDNNNFKIISENSLATLNQLTYVNFAFNRITVMPKNIFISDVHRNLMEIDFSYNLLKTISTSTFEDLPELQVIHLSSNKLEVLEKNSFYNLPFLLFIDLTFNKLKNISDSAFSYLPNVLRIDLMYNELTTFTLKSFKHVSNSSTPMRLNISNNKINKLDNEISSYLYINVLDISNNNLHETDSFKNLGYSLRYLHLSGNNLTALGNHAFGDLEALEYINLSRNYITSLRRRSFQGLPSLQELDISFNRIEQLQVEQFSNLKKLRILKLNNNKLKALPRDVFLNTRIEYLDLSDNLINLWPSISFSDIGFTLRSIQFGTNLLEYIDATLFINIQFLLELNLTNNKITVLPDNTFSNLSNLTLLDLSYNPLVTTNFKEIFLNTPRLRTLNLKSTGLYSVPPLSLYYLADLDVSQNNINDVYSLTDFKFLRILKISENKILNITNFGKHMPQCLRVLDISKNPIRKTSPHDFHQLRKLESLNIIDVKLTSDIFIKLHNLKILRITAFKNLSEMLSKIHGLKELYVQVNDDKIDDELFANLINNTKVNLIDITGSKLSRISSNAFYGLSRSNDLKIRITKTLIDDLPPGIFYSLKDVPKLTIDLSNNLITTLSPDSFYPNASSWDAVGTRSVIGGLDLSGNPLQCDCGLVWLGHWLRRWLRETTQIYMISKDDINLMIKVNFALLRLPVLLIAL